MRELFKSEKAFYTGFSADGYSKPAMHSKEIRYVPFESLLSFDWCPAIVCLAKRYPSLDGSDSSSETESLASTAKVNINATQMVPVPSMPGFYVPVQRSHRDLMSLVEKGKVAISSNSSCCSSTTSSIGDRHANLQNNNQHTEVNHT